MSIRINKTSAAYKRITIAGFVFKEFYAKRNAENEYYLSATIKCVCGKIEKIIWIISKTQLIKYKHKLVFDAAKEIEDSGAVSIEHLQEDGYTAEQIKYIRRAYN